MRRNSKNIMLSAVLLSGAFGFSGEAVAGCTPSLTSSSPYFNTCIGTGALYSNTTGGQNSAIGYQALYYNTTGSGNSALGNQALYYNTTGPANSALGSQALYFNTNGSVNSAVGNNSLLMNTVGNFNTAMGASSLQSNTTGNNNAAIGVNALGVNKTGSSNIGIGYNAGARLTTGSNNIAIANSGIPGESGTIRVGTEGVHKKTFIAGIRGITVTGSTVTVNSSGQLGVTLSSRRYKEDIKPMANVSDKLLELRPVTFRYKQADEDGKKPIQYGLIAEEVDVVMPELVVRNKDGSAETVAYQYIPSLLLNEYQKQHKELAATKAELAAEKVELAGEKAELAKTKADMAEMHSQIDKLNAITKNLIAALHSNTKTAMAR